MARGLFITFEGVEGAGKSVQSLKLYEALKEANVSCLHLREPGSTLISEKIREILLDNGNTEMKGITECYLYAASRAQLVNEVIRPNLESGKMVVCDRFVDSSYAYQGFARGLGLDTVMAVNKYAVADIMPDTTFYIDIEPEKGLRRRALASEMNRLDNEALAFHNKVYEGYRKLSEMFPERYVIISGDDSIDNVADNVISCFYERYSTFKKGGV